MEGGLKRSQQDEQSASLRLAMMPALQPGAESSIE